MIAIFSNYLNQSEYKLIRKFARFALNKLVRTSRQKKARITICISSQEEIKQKESDSNFRMHEAWCVYKGTDSNSYKQFEIVLNVKRINRRAKKQIVQFKNLLTDLGHEMVHVSQYLNSEMFDYVNGDVRYRGVVYDSSHYNDEEKYFFSPREVAAYGMEKGLYTLFCKQYSKNYE